MKLSQEKIIEISNQTGIKPEYVQSIETVYDIFCRFAGYTVEQVDRLVVESPMYVGRERKNNYKNLPISLTNKVKEIISTRGDISKIFSPYLKEKNFIQFLKKFYAQRLQPKDFYFSGVLTYIELKWNIEEDKTYDIKITSYQEMEEAA